MIFGRSLHICARGTPKFADRLKHAHADGTHRPVSHCFTADTDTPTAAALRRAYTNKNIATDG